MGQIPGHCSTFCQSNNVTCCESKKHEVVDEIQARPAHMRNDDFGIAMNDTLSKMTAEVQIDRTKLSKTRLSSAFLQGYDGNVADEVNGGTHIVTLSDTQIEKFATCPEIEGIHEELFAIRNLLMAEIEASPLTSGEYKGGMHEGKRDGSGRLLLKSNSSILNGSDNYIYHGQFEKDLRHGHGILTWMDGSMYRGQFLKDTQHGTGTFGLYDGSIQYEGSWVAGKRHGQGTYTNAEGITDTGTWHEDERVGNDKGTKKGHEKRAQFNIDEAWRDGASNIVPVQNQEISSGQKRQSSWASTLQKDVTAPYVVSGPKLKSTNSRGL